MEIKSTSKVVEFLTQTVLEKPLVEFLFCIVERYWWYCPPLVQTPLEPPLKSPVVVVVLDKVTTL